MKKILIVEDDEKVAKALELRIRNAGYDTAVARDGYSGVSMVAKHCPDLVLLDINMPAGSGFTVAERIRTLVPQRTPIVFITASKKPDFLERALALGASGYIEKPYDPAQVLTLLANVLNKPPMPASKSSQS
jgi:CheY-like chemotaxis protein